MADYFYNGISKGFYPGIEKAKKKKSLAFQKIHMQAFLDPNMLEN